MYFSIIHKRSGEGLVLVCTGGKGEGVGRCGVVDFISAGVMGK